MAKRNFTEEEYPHKELTEKIIKAAFVVHNRLGYPFPEKIYENAHVREMESMGLRVRQQKPMCVIYGGEPIGEFEVDELVEDKVIVELKAVKSLEKSFEAQLLHYLKVSGIQVGLLINFGKSVQVRRVILTHEGRRSG
jgi:GxxExxY protein